MSNPNGKTLLRAIEMIKAGETSATIVKLLGLNADQVSELRKRAKP